MKWVWILLFLLSCSKGNEMKNYYPHLKWNDQFKGVEVTADKEFQQKNVSGMKLTLGQSLNNHIMFSEMIVEIDPERAASIFKSKTMMIAGVAEGSGCPADLIMDFTPKEVKSQISMQFESPATEKFIQGVCGEDQNTLKNYTLMIYCKNIKTFYELKYFYPKKDKPIKQPIAVCF